MTLKEELSLQLDLQNIDFVKGVYKDNFENRKKGRVGQKFGGKKEEESSSNNKSKKISNDALRIIDIIKTIDVSKRFRYIDLLEKEYGINYEDFKSKDEENLKNISLNNIKDKYDFDNFENYKKYCVEIFKLRDLGDYPKIKEGVISNKKVKSYVDDLGVKVKDFKYVDGGNYAQAQGDTVELRDNSDLGTIVHELGHVYDNKYYDDEGVSKKMTNTSTSYGFSNSAETFAENFMNYFHNPNWLEKKLPNVYKDLDKNIKEEWKTTIRSMINI